MSTETHTHTLKQRMQSNISLVQKTICITLSACILGFIVLGSITYLYINKVAEQYSQQSLQAMGEQVAQVSAPMILRHDLVSLNIVLQALVDDKLITGGIITSSDNRLLAQAGATQTQNLHTVPIRSQDIALGKLQLQTPSFELTPGLLALAEILWPWALVGLMLSWVLGWWFGLRLIQPLKSLHEAQENISIYGYTAPLDDRRYDEWAIVNAGFNFINDQRLLHQPQDQMEINISHNPVKGSSAKNAPVNNPVIIDTRGTEAQKFDAELYDLAQELSGQEPSDQELSDQELSDQELSDQELSDQELSDQEPSDQEPSSEQASSQRPSDEQAKATDKQATKTSNSVKVKTDKLSKKTKSSQPNSYISNIQAKKINLPPNEPEPTHTKTKFGNPDKLANNQQEQALDNDPLMQPVNPSPKPQTERNRVVPVLTVDDLQKKPSPIKDVLMDETAAEETVSARGIIYGEGLHDAEALDGGEGIDDKAATSPMEEGNAAYPNHEEPNEAVNVDEVVNVKATHNDTFNSVVNQDEAELQDAPANLDSAKDHQPSVITETQPLSPNDADNPNPALNPDNTYASVLYINLNTREQRLLDDATKASLFRDYHRLAQEAVNIYQGTITIQENQDILVIFDQPQLGFTHCMNAICAGLFFIGMSQAYKLKQITQRQPTLKAQLVVHTGKLSDLDSIVHLAITMSQQQRLDDLMISRQVAYHPELQTRLIDMSNCAQLSNGAFALMQLPEEHQIALSKQVHHYAQQFKD